MSASASSTRSTRARRLPIARSPRARWCGSAPSSRSSSRPRSIQRTLGIFRSLLRQQLGQKINVEILEKALTLELSHFEDTELYDKLTRARREASSRPLSLVSQAFELGQSMVTLVGLGGLLAAFSPIALAVLIAAAIPPFIAEPKFSGDAFRLSRWRTPETREQMYLETVLAQDAYAKEVKLFGLGPRFLASLQARSSTSCTQAIATITIHRGVWALVLGTIGKVAFYGMYLWIAVATIDNAISLGDDDDVRARRSSRRSRRCRARSATSAACTRTTSTCRTSTSSSTRRR